MKTNRTRVWMIACISAFVATTALQASADETATTNQPDQTYTGMVTSVDPQEHTLGVKGFILSKTFNLGDTCAYVLLDKSSGMASDLRPGEKVTVSYQDANGVLAADRVEQEPMSYEGMVKDVDSTNNTLTVHSGAMDKTFQIGTNCAVVLRNDKSGALADIQPGDHVTVTYETPNDTLTARQIAQTSIEFTGTLTAIDLNERTVKARALFSTKKFNLADNCAIVINGKTDGQLSDLEPKEKLVISYDEINGVNIANRIAPAAEEETNSVAATPPMTSY